MKGKTNNSRPDGHLSEEECERILSYVRERADAARKNGAQRAVIDELVVILLLKTGLKAGELCRLNVGDVSPLEGPSDLAVHGKNDKTRLLPLDDDTREVIHRFVTVHRSKAEPDQPLLMGERGGRFAYASLYAKLKRLGEVNGIGNLSPNRLRRTFMIRIFEREQDLRLVQQRTGHATPKTTAQCLHPKVHCHACGNRIKRQESTQIDSGQNLCEDCIRELRGG